MGEWGGVLTAVVAAIGSVSVAWIGLRGEPLALRKLKSLNDALNNMSDSPSKTLLSEARDSVARSIADRILEPKAAYLFFRWTAGVLIALSILAIATYAVLAPSGTDEYVWILTAGTIGAFASSGATAASLFVQWRAVRKLEADVRTHARDVALSRLRTEAARGRTTDSDPSRG